MDYALLFRVVVDNEVERLTAATVERMNWLIDLEDPPFTTNDHYFTSSREKYLGIYKSQRPVSTFHFLMISSSNH